MSQKQHVVAVLGTGSIGMRHLGALRTAGAKVVAIPVRESRRAELEHEGLVTVSSLSQAALIGVGGVVVATDTSRHAADAAEVLKLGIKVLCEKPLALSVEDARILFEIPGAAENLRVAQCLRFDEGLNAFKRFIPEAGAIHSIRVECRSYLPDWRPGRDQREGYQSRAAEGGVLRDPIHDVDYTVW
ncbi:MAG: Gfo/Idh/MocA family oxidoreductase, partial [Myxococcota bacterium]